MSILSENIKTLRKRKNWSQEKLANKLEHFTRANIGSYEEERCEPGIHFLLKMSEMFNVTIDQLIKSKI